MIKQINSFKFKSFLLIVVCLIASSSAFAVGEKNNLLISRNLSKKLQNDLSNTAVEVKLNNVEEYRISRNETGFKGDAICILTDKDNQLPIRFDIKVNSASQNVLDVKYDFVDIAENYPATSDEDILIKELMKKIGSDYKTENIVIAIDGVEKVGDANSKNKFLGVGEVRIGDLVWNKIKFDVELDAQTQKANKIVYQLEK